MIHRSDDDLDIESIDGCLAVDPRQSSVALPIAQQHSDTDAIILPLRPACLFLMYFPGYLPQARGGKRRLRPGHWEITNF
jgi:hypothetical protein